MAVKKHELHDNRNQLDLNTLAQYIQLMNEQPNYLPPPNELVKNCQDIVKCLARARGEEDRVWELLQSVEDFLVRVVNSVHGEVRHEIITGILDKFYSYISDPQTEPCPAASVVLIVLDTSNTEATMAAARWVIQQEENAQTGVGFRASLSRLISWLYEWHGTPCLGDWVMAFIKALEENEQFDILIEVSIENLGPLFAAMENPTNLRQSVADVIFHLLGSLRDSTETLDKVSPNVERVLTNLASDSGQFSRQLLQNAVDVLTVVVDQLLNSLKGDAQDAFRAKYADVILCLERHMPTPGVKFSSMRAWHKLRRSNAEGANTNKSITKVGLVNLGNTCYMNSVMQALLATRMFSTHVILRMTAVPYWAKMAILFSKMMHSVITKLNPDDFFEVVKPPFFTTDNQHDSSEFLGYLFHLLQSFEHSSDRNFDYTRPALSANALRYRRPPTPPSDNDNGEPANNSPRPSSSAGGSKRSQPEHDNAPSIKRIRITETSSSYLRRDSYIDSMFGGILITRVECTECHACSLSRDVFRDLQLAFPESNEGWQHSVQSLLEYYCSKEKLDGDNMYECRDCGGLRDAERSVLIETTPKYLILVLKNFKFEPKLGTQTKLMNPMYYNHIVTLPTVPGCRPTAQSTYDLYAAVIHDGTTLDSGHYYTLAKDNNRWHMFNDDVVTDAEEKHMNSLPRCNTPYVLFYRRADVEEGPTPTLEELPPLLQASVAAHNKHYVDMGRQMRRRP